jgi:hypothetical protein
MAPSNSAWCALWIWIHGAFEHATCNAPRWDRRPPSRAHRAGGVMIWSRQAIIQKYRYKRACSISQAPCAHREVGGVEGRARALRIEGGGVLWRGQPGCRVGRRGHGPVRGAAGAISAINPICNEWINRWVVSPHSRQCECGDLLAIVPNPRSHDRACGDHLSKPSFIQPSLAQTHAASYSIYRHST